MTWASAAGLALAGAAAPVDQADLADLAGKADPDDNDNDDYAYSPILDRDHSNHRSK